MLLDIVKKDSVDRSVVLRIIDSADGTPETGVVFNTSGIDLWYRREGAAKTSITEATLAALTTAHSDGGFLHVGDGYYRLDLPDAAFATGANSCDVGGTVTGMVVVGGRVRLVDINWEDSVRGGLTALPNAAAEAAGGLYTRGTGVGQINQPANGEVDANLVKWRGTQPNALTSGRVEVLVGAITNGVIAAATFAANALDAVWSTAARLLTAGTNIALAKGTGVTGFTDLDAAGVRTAVGLASANLDTQLTAIDDFLDTEVAAIKVVTDKVDDTLEDDAGTFRFTTNALEQAPTGGSAPTAGEIADAVWDEAISGHAGAGSTGEQLSAAGSAGDPWATALPGGYSSGQAGKIVGDNLNATIGSRASQASVDDLPTNAELATALAAADDAILAAIAALNNLSQANIRTAIGLATANLDTQLDALPTNAELATALAAADDAVLAAIAALNNLSIVNVRTAVGLASANLDTQLGDLPTNAELAAALASADDAVLAAIAALNNLSSAQVNAEVVDALATDTYAEPAGVPAATASLKDKINWLATLARNKVTQSATSQALRNDADTADLATAAVSDSGTVFTRAEWL